MTGLSLLYVDDEEALLEITKEYIEQSGNVYVETAICAREGLKKMESGRYDAVISDYQMPEIDGLAFLKIIRAQTKNLPFILFSGKGREDVIIEALNNGADFFVQKGGNPRVQFAELMNMVWQAVLRRQSQIEVARSERRLHDIINSLPDATLVIDCQGKVIAWNRAIEEMTGVAAADMLGKGNYEYAIPFYGKRREMLLDLVLASDEELASRNYRFIRREGIAVVAETIHARPKGREVHLWAKANPLYDETGALAGAIETVRDITDLRRTEDELKEVNRRLNLMSRVTRHEIRNKLGGITAFADLARASSQEPAIRLYLDRIIRAADGITEQIGFTRDYQMLGSNAPKWQNLGEVVSRAVEQLDTRGVEIRYPLWHLECYADPLLERVFYSLADNAMNYGESVTRITFSVTGGKGGLILTCEDNGRGIPADVKERIFERGFGRNTGLGLFLSREILAITGMSIRESGEPGRGARFDITIPPGVYRYVSRSPVQEGRHSERGGALFLI
jgi:PAS domain S-box-containing protein